MNIDYTIKYSKRKTISIIIDRDRTVTVRAPHNVSMETIEKELSKRKLLLFQKINHPQKYNLPREQKEFVSGESLFYLGKSYKLEIVDNAVEEISFDNAFLINRASHSKAKEVFRKWYIRQAEEKIIPRVRHFAKQLGVLYNNISILDLKYRWGSCTPKNNIHFNWRLIKAPVDVIDYIIVHELTHLIETNHTDKFWNIVSVQLPNYNRAKGWLKENGDLIEIDF